MFSYIYIKKMLTLLPKSGMVSSQIHFGGNMFGLIITLIIIGLVVGHFGFWTVIGSFFIGLLSVLGIIAIAAAIVFVIVMVLDI